GESPMDANELLSQITIPTPCRMDWNRMHGDERTRRCAACDKHVYDFTAMTSDEALALIRAQDGEVCGRLFRRPDGRLVKADCPPLPSPSLSPQPWQFNLRTVMALIAGIAAALGFTKMLASVEPPGQPLMGSVGSPAIWRSINNPPNPPTTPSGSCSENPPN